MEILRLGLLIGALACLYVSWASWSAGYPPEIAMVRGIVGFVAISIVAYLGALVVATAPGRPAAESGGSDHARAPRAETAATASARTSEPQAPPPAVRPPITGAAPADDQETNERLAA